MTRGCAYRAVQFMGFISLLLTTASVSSEILQCLMLTRLTDISSIRASPTQYHNESKTIPHDEVSGNNRARQNNSENPGTNLVCNSSRCIYLYAMHRSTSEYSDLKTQPVQLVFSSQVKSNLLTAEAHTATRPRIVIPNTKGRYFSGKITPHRVIYSYQRFSYLSTIHSLKS